MASVARSSTPRSLVPFNYEPVIESIRKTRKILLASDACERGSYRRTHPKTCFVTRSNEKLVDGLKGGHRRSPRSGKGSEAC